MRKTRLGVFVAVLAIAMAVFALPAVATHVVEVTIDPVATWDPGTGAITVTGTVTCNSGTLPDVDMGNVAVTQGNNPNNIRNGASGSFSPNPNSPCDDPGNTYAWSATVTASSGSFTPGMVTATATTECCDDATNTTALTVSATILVVGGPPS